MSERVRVGRVGKPHGIQGAFFVEGASEAPERFAKGAELYAAGEPARVVESKRSRGRAVIRLDRDVERGAPLEVDRDALPPPEEDSYYVFQLVGLEVEEEGGRRLGTVTEVIPAPANDVLELSSGVALPLVDACVLEIDLDRRLILVAAGFAEPG
jgi:16S rRNA processing protein RimM